MKLFDIEPNTHSPHDWSKRLVSSYIYGTVDGQVAEPSVIYVRSVGEMPQTTLSAYKACDLYLRVSSSNINVARLNDLNVLSFRPEPGIYNFQDRYPVMVTHTSFRQWHFGVTPETIRIQRLNNTAQDHNYTILDSCFNAVYPTIGNAVEDLKKGKRKHIAISPKVSILASGSTLDRFVLLYKFLPLATINNGMWFPSQSGKSLEKIANEYKQVLMELI